MNERMKILIGYDGSECAEAALGDLKRAGLPSQAEVLVMSLAEVWLPPPPPSSYEIVEEAMEVEVPSDLKKIYARGSKAVEEAEAMAARARERIEKMFPEWTVETFAGYGSPTWEIVLKADTWKPDLVMVGSHGRSAIGRFVLGSVSQKVVTEAHCSVRVSRGREEADGSPIRIVIGVDGSPESDAAIQEVAGRHWPAGTKARVILVDDPLVPTTVGRLIPPVAKWIDESNEEERAWVARIAARAVEQLLAAGLDAEADIYEGNPKRLLVEEAEKWNADAIFVGSTGSGSPIARFMLGSVSTAVVSRAHCSVEVVRRLRTENEPAEPE